MKYKKYPKYKNSGLDWIREIPKEWEVKKLKFLSDVCGRIGYRGYTVNDIVDQGEGAITLSPSNIIDDKFTLKKKTYLSWIKYDESPEIQVFENDILLCKTASIGKNCIVPKHSEKMTINPQLVVLKPFKISSKFLSFFMNCNEYKHQVNSAVEGGAIKTISQEKLLNHYILFPHLEQQNQIEEFLCKKITKFDELISKSKSQVTLLEEKRQATINQAVTKGLDPSVEMEDSGIEWIGEIPKHWEIKPIKYVLKNSGDGITIGPFGTSIARLDFSKKSEFRIFGQNHAINADFIANPLYVSEQKFLELKKYEIFPNDVVVSRMGTIGKAVVVPKNTPSGIIHSHLIRIRINPKIITQKFFKFLINSVYYVHYYLNSNSTGAIMKGLNVSIIRSTKICLPPKKELDEIGDFLETQTTKFDELISKSKGQVILLEEKRQALITAAVTGKIDVRGTMA
jgi:type I restriction enzyme, S subunit